MFAEDVKTSEVGSMTSPPVRRSERDGTAGYTVDRRSGRLRRLDRGENLDRAVAFANVKLWQRGRCAA